MIRPILSGKVRAISRHVEPNQLTGCIEKLLPESLCIQGDRDSRLRDILLEGLEQIIVQRHEAVPGRISSKALEWQLFRPKFLIALFDSSLLPRSW